MESILGIDYGEKRIGLAVTDPEQKFVFEMDIVPAEEFFSALPEIIREREVGKIVLGYPLNMSGEKTAKTEEVLGFKKELEEKSGLAVELIDERLTSKEAEKLAGTGKNIDSLAARIMLETYINKNVAIPSKSDI